MRPTTVFMAFSGTPASWRATTTPTPATTRMAAPAAALASPSSWSPPPRPRTMMATSRPSRNVPLKATTNPVASRPRLAPSVVGVPRCPSPLVLVVPVFAADRELLDVLGEDGVLVVLGLEAHGPQDGLAQPLQAEHEEQGPDDGPQHVDRDQVDQGRPQRPHQHDEHDEGGGGAFQRRAPAPGHTGGDDDGEGFDALDGTGQEHGHGESDVTGRVHLANGSFFSWPGGSFARQRRM